jgi:cysteine synthase
MTTKRIERQIDDALLATATWAGFLYVRRRARRMFHNVEVGAAVVVAGVGAVGVVAGTAAWYRNRAKRSAAVAPADSRRNGAGAPPATTVGANSGGEQ